ncbi:hypothetical protein N5D48_17660 [Pseudomonas sp. GD03858]|uniref:hypothetical protein n=1 Tax=unclassified Pseudomonas TaxID=196821 RepID=UPI00244A3488|nr:MULTISPECIES: hypothetical protein [unclassified Pseudomonas]MDH0649033.1 hypothetical protein [Pseudomonas sp. GD03867]MDH0664236.1 hypothetical protein [Pseudomonas sp. GD03858]
MTTPVILDAANAVLDPIDAAKGATVKVAYPKIQPDHQITMKWGTQPDTAPKSGIGDAVDFNVSPQVVLDSLGSTLPVSYTVTLPDGQAQISSELALTVKALDMTRMPTPQVPEAQDETLDLDSFEGDAHVQVDPWPLIVAGQRYWIRASGVLEDGSPHKFPVRLAGVVDDIGVENGLLVPLLRSELQRLQEGSRLTIVLRVAFDGVNDEQRAQEFPQLDLGIVGASGHPRLGMRRLEYFDRLTPGATFRAGQHVPNLSPLTIEILEGAFLVSASNRYALVAQGTGAKCKITFDEPPHYMSFDGLVSGVQPVVLDDTGKTVSFVQNSIMQYFVPTDGRRIQSATLTFTRPGGFFTNIASFYRGWSTNGVAGVSASWLTPQMLEENSQQPEAEADEQILSTALTSIAQTGTLQASLENLWQPIGTTYTSRTFVPLNNNKDINIKILNHSYVVGAHSENVRKITAGGATGASCELLFNKERQFYCVGIKGSTSFVSAQCFSNAGDPGEKDEPIAVAQSGPFIWYFLAPEGKSIRRLRLTSSGHTGFYNIVTLAEEI